MRNVLFGVVRGVALVVVTFCCLTGLAVLRGRVIVTHSYPETLRVRVVTSDHELVGEFDLVFDCDADPVAEHDGQDP